MMYDYRWVRRQATSIKVLLAANLLLNGIAVTAQIVALWRVFH